MKQHWNDNTGRWEPPTNADNIRAMSDEDLANAMVMGCVDCVAKPCSKKKHNSYFYKKQVLEWLKQPYKEEQA